MSKKFLTPTKALFLTAAGGYLGYRQYMKLTHRDMYDYYFDSTRNVSRVTGYLATCTIPVGLRKFIFTNFSKAYNVKLDELTEPDLTKYNTFLDFFTRTIKPLPVDADPLSVVSPADCKVLMCSEVQEDSVLIVKGVNYSLGELLTGIPGYPMSYNTLQNIKRNKDNKLYQCILYLAPGDYHRFHSPAKILIKQRNYIYGTLLPVKLEYALTGKMLYDKNERVTVLGDWNEGFMSMVFVGALNVGSIGLTFDPELRTNLEPSSPFSPVVVKSFTGGDPEYKDIQNLGPVSKGLPMEKGAEVGRFNLGSSIVLFFEANKNFKFNIDAGDVLRYGQVIGK